MAFNIEPGKNLLRNRHVREDVIEYVLLANFMHCLLTSTKLPQNVDYLLHEAFYFLSEAKASGGHICSQNVEVRHLISPIPH
jgi:hypothetical protein